MRIRQYVYFRLASEEIEAAEITQSLGVVPDRVLVRGTKRANPPAPATHSWELHCDLPGRTVDDQIEQVLSRVRPVAEAIRELSATTDIVAVLQIVRDLDAEDGQEDSADEPRLADGEVLTKLAGQHHLLGWHLDAETLTFLASVGADIDCDEYGS